MEDLCNLQIRGSGNLDILNKVGLSKGKARQTCKQYRQPPSTEHLTESTKRLVSEEPRLQDEVLVFRNTPLIADDLTDH